MPVLSAFPMAAPIVEALPSISPIADMVCDFSVASAGPTLLLSIKICADIEPTLVI
jgi:hypothetical protein